MSEQVKNTDPNENEQANQQDAVNEVKAEGVVGEEVTPEGMDEAAEECGAEDCAAGEQADACHGSCCCHEEVAATVTEIGTNAPVRTKSKLVEILTFITLPFSVLATIVFGWAYFQNAANLGTTKELIASIVYVIVQIAPQVVYILLATYLLWRFVFKKQYGVGLVCLTLLLTAFMVWNTVNIFGTVNVETQVQKELTTMRQTLTMGGEVQTDFPRSEFGEYGKVLELVAEYSIYLRDDMSQYRAELEEFNIAGLISTEVLTDPTLVEAAQKKMKDFVAVYDKYETQAKGRIDDVQKDMKKLRVSPRVKEETLVPAVDGLKRGFQIIVQLMDYEKQINAEFEQLLTLFHTKAGQFKYVNDDFLFDTAEDNDAYQAHALKIQQLAYDEYRLMSGN